MIRRYVLKLLYACLIAVNLQGCSALGVKGKELYLFDTDAMKSQQNIGALSVGTATSGYWTPTEEEASKAVDITERYIARNWVGRLPRNYENSYVHQVYGVLADERSVVVVGICRDIAREYGDEIGIHLVQIVDGGTCVYHSIVSVQDERVIEFAFNPVGG